MNKFSVHEEGPATIYMGCIKDIWRHFEGVCVCVCVRESEVIEFKFTSDLFSLQGVGNQISLGDL